MLIKRTCPELTGSIVYLDPTERRAIVAAFRMPNGSWLVYGPGENILSARTEQEADSIAESFAFAL